VFSFIYINYTVPHDRNCMLFVSLRTVSSKFLGFSQKPLDGSIPTATRHINDEFLFLFWFEPPGGDEFLPSGATPFAVFVDVCCYSCKCVCVFCDWCEWVLLDTFLDQNGLSNCGMVRVEG